MKTLRQFILIMVGVMAFFAIYTHMQDNQKREAEAYKAAHPAEVARYQRQAEAQRQENAQRVADAQRAAR